MIGRGKTYSSEIECYYRCFCHEKNNVYLKQNSSKNDGIRYNPRLLKQSYNSAYVK